MLTVVEITVVLVVGFVIGVLSCPAYWRPRRHKDEAVSLKVTEGKDEF